MKKTSFYEYNINLKFYQIRESYSDIFEYSRRYRDSFLTCLRKVGNSDLAENRRKEIFRGSTIMLIKPKTHVRGYMLMTPSGIIQDWDTVKRLKPEFSQWFKKPTYSCLNKAANINLPCVILRTPIDDMLFNIFMEEFLREIGCEFKARAQYY